MRPHRSPNYVPAVTEVVASSLEPLVGKESDMQRAENRFIGIVIVAVLVMFCISGASTAAIRLQVHYHKRICEIRVTSDNHHRTGVLYHGPMVRGRSKVIRGREGMVICVQRSRVPSQCNSGWTRPQCVVDPGRNRTKLLDIR